MENSLEYKGIARRIVIVDDEPVITQTLTNLLLLECDYDLHTFNDPNNAIEYIMNNPVDLVISDFLMPQMNGIEFLSEVKRINTGITLVLLTGYADKESAIKAINEVGIYRYMQKPWDNTDLLLCIKNGLERSHLLESLEQKIVQLDSANKKLANYNQELELAVEQRTKELNESNLAQAKINLKLNAIINNCADTIVTVNQEGIIQQVNPMFAKLTGVTDKQAVGKSFNKFFIVDNKPSVVEALNPKEDVLLREYKIINTELEKTIPVEMTFAPILSDSGQEFKYVGVIRDVTLQSEMDRLRDDFIATLTHDLRTPLLAAIQTLRFFLDGSLGGLSEKQHVLLDTMLISNTDMLGLVNALLEVYKYEAGKLVLCRDNINLSDLVRHCVNEIRPLAIKKSVAIDVQVPDESFVCIDKQELRRVIANFLGNAVNYTSKDGNVTIKIEDKPEQLVVSVQDTGMGIPASDVPKMFNRFSQGTSQKRSTGTGLGLYLSRQIVEAHGGKVWLESEVGKGSNFCFSIEKNKQTNMEENANKGELQINNAN